MLTRLSIYTFGVTNYNSFIEDVLKKANRKPDTKLTLSQISSAVRNREALVYKMQGDEAQPFDEVLTKEDYIQYERELFLEMS